MVALILGRSTVKVRYFDHHICIFESGMSRPLQVGISPTVLFAPLIAQLDLNP